MIIIGDKYIDYPKLYKINASDEIKNTPSNSIVYFDFNKDIMRYSQKNSIKYFVNIKNIVEAILSNSLGAKAIIIKDLELAKKIQKIAENYMFDTKVLILIENEIEIENIAKYGIDGVIYKF